MVKDVTTMRLVSRPRVDKRHHRASALAYKNGFLTNAASMTAKYDATATTLTVAQNTGLYVGSVRMSADGTTKWVANPAAAAGGGNCQLLLWNMYNRVLVGAVSKDSTDTWTYTTATWRAANASNSNRITFVLGLNEDAVQASYTGFNDGATNVYAAVGVGLDSTSAFSGSPASIGDSGSAVIAATATYLGQPGIGSHFVQALEISGATVGVWAGDNGAPTSVQMSLTFYGRM
jgi:hypothetical protein